jgi:DNA-binding GntR family transcriptional regulator
MSNESRPSRRRKARYLTVAETLTNEIADARYLVGGMIPTELELCERFDVSRYTVREALRQLEQAGLVERRQGSGTRVRAQRPSTVFTQQLSSVRDFLQYPDDTRLHVHSARTITVDAALAGKLKCAERKQFHRVSCIRRSSDGAPFCWTDVYVGPRHAAVSGVIGKEPLPVYALMEKLFDLRPGRVSVELFADTVDPNHLKQMKVKAGTPALFIVRRYFDTDDNRLLTSVSEHPAGSFIYSIALEQDWASS